MEAGFSSLKTQEFPDLGQGGRTFSLAVSQK